MTDGHTVDSDAAARTPIDVEGFMQAIVDGRVGMLAACSTPRFRQIRPVTMSRVF
jgi:hypothetical protein